MSKFFINTSSTKERLMVLSALLAGGIRWHGEIGHTAEKIDKTYCQVTYPCIEVQLNRNYMCGCERKNDSVTLTHVMKEMTKIKTVRINDKFIASISNNGKDEVIEVGCQKYSFSQLKDLYTKISDGEKRIKKEEISVIQIYEPTKYRYDVIVKILTSLGFSTTSSMITGHFPWIAIHLDVKTFGGNIGDTYGTSITFDEFINKYVEFDKVEHKKNSYTYNNKTFIIDFDNAVILVKEEDLSIPFAKIRELYNTVFNNGW